MRTIKFRVFNKKTGKWVHEEPCDILGETILCGGWMTGVKLHELNDIEVMQFTGLLDKNGKEVFEGDYIKCIAAPSGKSSKDSKEMKGKISYQGFGFTVSVWYKNEWWAYGAIDFLTFEVIGNIYEVGE